MSRRDDEFREFMRDRASPLPSRWVETRAFPWGGVAGGRIVHVAWVHEHSDAACRDRY